MPQAEPTDGIDPLVGESESGEATAVPIKTMEMESPPPPAIPVGETPETLEVVVPPDPVTEAIEAESPSLTEGSESILGETPSDFEESGPLFEAPLREQPSFSEFLSTFPPVDEADPGASDGPDFGAVLEAPDSTEGQGAEAGNIFANDEYADESVIAGLWVEEPLTGIFTDEIPSEEEVSVEEIVLEEHGGGFRLEDFRNDLPPQPGADANDGIGMVVEIDESEVSDREFPGFLDDFETFAMPSPGVERESDRALAALRTARLRAEEGGLLRDRSIPSEVVEVVEAAEIAPPGENPVLTEFVEEAAEAVPVAGEPMAWDDVLPEESIVVPAPEEWSGEDLDPNSRDDAGAVEEAIPEEDVESIDGTLADEIAACVEGAMCLEAVVAAVICDEDGFLLYRNPREDAGLPRETGILIDALRQADARLGMGGESVTQVSLDGTHWKCLLRAWEDDIVLLAGLLVERPLESGEVQVWRQALCDTCRVIATKLL